MVAYGDKLVNLTGFGRITRQTGDYLSTARFRFERVLGSQKLQGGAEKF
jgi:hypothetical protein